MTFHSANFSGSFAEYMQGGFAQTYHTTRDLKGDRMLEVATNIRFNPEHFPSMSLRTMEQILVNTILPNGHRTADFTRPEDGDQKIIGHYIPFTECVRRQLSRRAFAGHCISTWSMSLRDAQGIQGPADSVV